MDFQQSQTYANLLQAYDRQLRASTQYLIYGDIARQDGYREIGNIFDDTARNEITQAVTWLRFLNNGVLPVTLTNLSNAIDSETSSANDLYRSFAQTARNEGFDDIAAIFNGVANIELNHTLDFQIQYDNILRGQVFCKDTSVLWICMACGNILNGVCAPEICPVCFNPQSYYRVYSINPPL